MLPLIPVLIVGLGAAAVGVSARRKKRGLTTEREQIYNSAMASGTVDQLNTLATTYESEGLKTLADCLRQRAKIRALPPDVKRERAAAYKKAMLSSNVPVLQAMVKIYQGEGCTGAAKSLQQHIEFIQAGGYVAPAPSAPTGHTEGTPEGTPSPDAAPNAEVVTTVPLTAQGTPAATSPTAQSSLATPAGVSPPIQAPAPGTPTLPDGSSVPSVGSEMRGAQVGYDRITSHEETDADGSVYLVTDEDWTDDGSGRPAPPNLRRPAPPRRAPNENERPLPPTGRAGRPAPPMNDPPGHPSGLRPEAPVIAGEFGGYFDPIVDNDPIKAGTIQSNDEAMLEDYKDGIGPTDREMGATGSFGGPSNLIIAAGSAPHEYDENAGDFGAARRAPARKGKRPAPPTGRSNPPSQQQQGAPDASGSGGGSGGGGGGSGGGGDDDGDDGQ